MPGLEWLEANVIFYPALDNSVDSIGTSEIWDDFGFKGEGTTIAILDTGVDFEHESLDDLDDNLEYKYILSLPALSPYRFQSHHTP